MHFDSSLDNHTEPEMRIIIERTKTMLYIRNGRIKTMAGIEYPNGQILIADGKIRAVGEHVEKPEGVREIDAGGHLVTPGMIDAHCHVGLFGSALRWEGDDANEPVSDTVRGIIDGHIMLSRKVATQNRYPAIDILSSVSRLMSDIVMPEHKAAAGKIRKLLSVYESNIDLVSIGAYKKGTNKELDDALMRIDKIYEFLQQKTDESFSLDEAVIRMIQLTE